MKKIIIILMVTLSLFMFSGCANNETNDTDTTGEITTESTETTENTETTETSSSDEVNEQETMDAFDALGKSEPIEIVEMSTFLKENIEKVSAENADLMLQIYEKAQMQVLPTYQDAFIAESVQSILLTYSIEEIRENQVKEEAVQVLLTESASVGYKIEAIEGTVVPYVDYSYFAQFSEYATESTKAFYDLMKIESDAPSQKDAALIIPWENVLKRGVSFEAYLEDYPDSYYEERVFMHLEGYKNLAINGSANVPLFDYDTNEMNDEAKAAYTAFVDQGLQTEFATLIKSYVDVLEAHDYIKTAEVEAFITEQN